MSYPLHRQVMFKSYVLSDMFESYQALGMHRIHPSAPYKRGKRDNFGIIFHITPFKCMLRVLRPIIRF